MTLAATQWLVLAAILIFGALPFCAIGLAIGLLVRPNSATAVVNLLYLPLSFCSGLWIPISQLPEGVRHIAVFLPTDHLGALALGAVGLQAARCSDTSRGSPAGVSVPRPLQSGRSGATKDARMVSTPNARGLRLPPLLAGVWLVYLGFIPLALWSGHASTGQWLRELAGIAVFFVLYLAMYNVSERYQLAAIAGMFALAAIFIPTDPSCVVYVIFGAAFFGWTFDDPVVAYRWLIGYTAAFAVLAYVEHMYVATWVPGIVFSCTHRIRPGPFRSRATSDRATAPRVRRGRAAHEDRRARTYRARSARRPRPHAFAHRAQSELASKLAESDPARAAIEIRDVERIARESLAEVRSAVAGYRGAGVAAEIDHARDVFASAGIELDCEAADLRIPAQYEGVLALAIREAVTNVVRHAGAKSVRLILRTENGQCRFEIADDGRGTAGEDGAGLRGMRERVEALGGILERTVGNGTRIVVSLPLGSAF